MWAAAEAASQTLISGKRHKLCDLGIVDVQRTWPFRFHNWELDAFTRFLFSDPTQSRHCAERSLLLIYPPARPCFSESGKQGPEYPVSFACLDFGIFMAESHNFQPALLTSAFPLRRGAAFKSSLTAYSQSWSNPSNGAHRPGSRG